MKTIASVAGISAPISNNAIGPVVYFLLQGDRVVYVGQTTNFHARYGHYLRDWSSRFDSIAYLETPIDRLHEVERRWIEFFDPPLNKKDAPHYRGKRGSGAPVFGRNVMGLNKLAKSLGLDSADGLAKYTEAELLEMRGIGISTVECIVWYLSSRGLSLRREFATHSNAH